MSRINQLFSEDLIALNLGLDSFGENLRATGAVALQVDWQPPAGGDAELGRTLALLTYNEALRGKIEDANETAMSRMLAARPLLVDIQTAREALGLDDNLFLHAGPPIAFTDMAGPMQGAAIGAALFEGLAATPDEARRMLAAGDIRFSPCHHYDAVGPMAGLISPSMPVFVVHNEDQGNLSYSNINEGLGKVLRMGAYSDDVIDRLRWMATVLAPALKQVITPDTPIDLRALTAQALQMGDEGHNRNIAATALLFKQLTNRLLAADVDEKTRADVLGFVSANDHFFLNLSMAACKAMLDAANDVPYSTVVTVMARNGIEFGVRVSGLGDRWFTAPAELPEGLYFPGYSAKDAALDIGDSSIAETAGIGGFVMATAPAIVGFVGGNAQDALAYTREMQGITLAQNPNYTLPILDFQGAPAGIDLRRVLESGVLPVINTGIAHKEAGVGQVGAGVVRAPMACFVAAMHAFATEWMSEVTSMTSD
jgi:hypothetical protein